MPIVTDVKIFRSSDAGAPVLNGAAGALASLLYACLVTGYNTLAPSSVTRDGDTVTVTYGSAHGHALHQVINVSGANEADYNGDFRITEVATNTLQYKLATGVTPATPATGTIATKMAPAGWTRPYSGTNKAVFKGDVSGTGCYLRVDDTNSATRRGVMRGYVSMTDVDTGTDPFPLSTALYWYKSTDDGTTRIWMLIADSKLFYFGNQDGSNNQLHAFGDIVTYKPGDAYHCILTGSDSASDAGDNYVDILLTKPTCRNVTRGTRISIARAYSGMSGSTCGLCVVGAPHRTTSSSFATTIQTIMGYDGYPYPHNIDNGVIYGPAYLSESDTAGIRGLLPGIYDPWHEMSSAIALTNLSLTADIPVPGRRALFWRARGGNIYLNISGYTSYATNPATGCSIIDCTGPWR
jgi:hypothetical protein